MKALHTYLLAGAFCLCSHLAFSKTTAPEVTDREWEALIQLLIDENWAKAEVASLGYLNRFGLQDDSLATPAILRYMYLRCIGARVGEKEYTREEGEDKLHDLVGSPIITPPKTFHQKCLFNCFQLSEDKEHFYSCSSNKSMTVLQIFETYDMEDPELLAHTDELEGKNLRLGAIIKEIKTGGYAFPRLEIAFEHAFIWEED